MDRDSEVDLEQVKIREKTAARELSRLFGEDIVTQASVLDIADINLTDEMTRLIADGIRQLKQLRQQPDMQKQWLQQQEAGLQLLLCLWILDMDLLDKIMKT